MICQLETPRKTVILWCKDRLLRLQTIMNKDYISLIDKVKNFEGGSALIEQWLKNKDTVLFLGVWEKINTPVLIPSNSRELKMKQVETVSTSLL